jgi:Asp-tRNA(Asn)/Glu-tRNA(Gln) amidotransferase A subunit family amidase
MASDEIDQLTEKVRAAQVDLERITEALYSNLDSPTYKGRYTHAVLRLDKAEAELDQALNKFRRKKF